MTNRRLDPHDWTGQPVPLWWMIAKARQEQRREGFGLIIAAFICFALAAGIGVLMWLG